MVSWSPISRTEHIDSYWRPRQGFEFAAGQQLIEVFSNEIATLLPHYVIGFTKEEKTEKFQFIALLGLGGERNLYVTPDNKWLCSIVPSALTSYPFALLNSEDGERILCINKENVIDKDEADAALIFDNENELSPASQEKLDFLTQCDQARVRTSRACQALAEANVIVPWPLKVEQGEDKVPLSIDGLYKIDEVALNTLDANIFANLRETGSLAIAYAHMFSLSRLNDLSQRVTYMNKLDIKDKPKPELSSLFEDDGNLNFDAIKF
jgi:hypothetical protein